jgi:hypothetical protein
MVASSTLVPPKVDAKPSSSTLVPRKDSNASSSGAFSDGSRSFGQEENSSDSLFSHTSPSSSSSSHYVIKCNVNQTNLTPTPPVTITPRVKVTVQQPSITARSSRFDSSPENISPSSSSHLKTPATNIMTSSTTSSAPEFSFSGASSVEDSDDLLYENYSKSQSRQSNPSPELSKNTLEDWAKTEQRYLPRSKSEIHTGPIEQSQQQTTHSQIKTVSIKMFIFRLFLIESRLSYIDVTYFAL